MEPSRQGETLTELRLRHIQLILDARLLPKVGWPIRQRLLNQLTSVQIDLLPLFEQNDQAMLLVEQLNALAKEPMPDEELLNRLVALLKPPG